MKHIPLFTVMMLLVAACSGGPTPEPTVFIPVIGTGQPTLPGGPTQVSVTEAAPAEWAALGLTGRLQYTLGKEGVQQLELATGETRMVFSLSENTWLTSAATAPDGSSLALAYAPPPPEGVAQLGYTSLYGLPGDCAQREGGCTDSDLQNILMPADPHEAFFSPTWAHDGQSLLFAHFTPSQADSSAPFKYTLERMPAAGGERTLVVDNAIWPSFSRDGKWLVYVWFDPVDYSNDLYLANADGTGQHVLVDPSAFDAVDAPLFTADNQYVIFSAVGNGQPATPTPAPAALALGAVERLLGVRTAFAAPDAHNVPSDWWRVPVGGGPPERLTRQFDTGLFGDASPDGEWIGFVSATGIYVMRPDGSQLTRLNRTAGAGTVEWLP
jgi:hypothetical protein